MANSTNTNEKANPGGRAAPIVGIDLGTTYSLVSVVQDGVPTIITNSLGERLTPSVVSVDADRVIVGAAARARAVTHPHLTAEAFKRDMGTDRTYSLGRHTFRAEQLSALVLAELKRDAEAALGMPITEAVITVPAYFGEAQRQATRIAAELAGLRAERIINEPTAAALAFGLSGRDREARAIVLDLGGGTFDVTVLEIIEGVIEVQASAGDSRLGGEDFLDLVVDHVTAEIRARHAVDVTKSASLVARVRDACESCKRAMSSRETATLLLAAVATPRGVQDIELSLNRADIEALWAPVLRRIQEPIARAIRDAHLSPGDFDEVILVGGATRMPCFVELVARTFGRVPNRSLAPDEAVALGAGIQAALKEGNQAVADLVVTDVAPFSMGIAAAVEFAGRDVLGMFHPIIERGTVIPVSRSSCFRTIKDFQSAIDVEIFQGEHSQCAKNTKLGQFTIKGIPKAPAGEQAIEVRFTYDLNGLLEVDASVVATGERKSILLEQRPGTLSRKDVAKAIATMAMLKFHPRDSLPNQTALARAEAAFVELTGPERTRLSGAIASMHAALESQDRVEIEAARESLVAVTQLVRK